MEFHRAMKQQELERDGQSAREARLAAHKRARQLTRSREEARAVWIWPWLESVWQDIVYAVRSLRRQPGFTLVAIVALGVAIGLNTSLFTVFAGLALRPMTGITEPARVVTVTQASAIGRGGRGPGGPAARSVSRFRSSGFSRRGAQLRRAGGAPRALGQPRVGSGGPLDACVCRDRQLLRRPWRPDGGRPRLRCQ